jgi:hypothetical protein
MKRNYKQEYNNYHSKPSEIKNRSSRNKARTIMENIYGQKIKGKDIDHIDGNPKNNKLSNLRISTIHKNRSKK